MSTIELYSVRDKLVGFGKPFECDNDSAAVRLYQRALKDPKSDIYANPGDYELFYVGSFEIDSGLFASRKPLLLCHGDSDHNLYLDTEVDFHVSHDVFRS